jgi:alkylation response protein AidB-like acyl-CoA dehydrogenase
MIDEEDLAALREGIARVLEGDADRERVHAHLDGGIDLGGELWRQAVELGWLAIGLPEQCGGLGLGVEGLDALYREVGSRTAPGPFIATLAAAQVLAGIAEEAVQQAWLPRIALGEARLAVPARITADPADDETWLLGDADSDAALIPLGSGEWGLVAIEGGRPIELWDRTRTIFTATLATARPLAVFDGAAASRLLSRQLCLAVGADSIGGARAITLQTIAYMKEREQFGKAIASFQALKHRIADHMTEIVSGEEFLGLAVASAASGNPDADIWAKLAKARCTESCLRIAQDCLQLHGGVGFTWEFDVHIFLNRARLNELLVAPNTQMKDDAAAGLAHSIRAGREPLELA